MNDIHLVASSSAAGSLRVATLELGLPGEPFCIRDDLSLGPLTDGHERAAFWHALAAEAREPELHGVFGDSDEHGFDTGDAFAPWQHLVRRLGHGALSRILIWTSGSGADHVLLRMACHWLGGAGVQLAQVHVPAREDYHSVSVHPPEALVGFVSSTTPIEAAQVRVLADQYEAIARRPEMRREVDAQGRLEFKDISAHDEFIVECSPPEWTRAARVVGDVMSRCDPRNGLGDILVISRLRHLIAAGRIEADQVDRSIRSFNIRKAKD